MGPEKWKDEVPARDAAEREKPAAEKQGVPVHEAADPREDEGWSQPESSAQKTPQVSNLGKHGDPTEG